MGTRAAIVKRKFGPVAALLGIVLLAPPALLRGQAPNRKITRAADLPRFIYRVEGKVEDLLKMEEKFRPFAAQVRKDVNSVLADYDIEEASTKRQLLTSLAMLDVLEGKPADALKRLDEVKALEEKPAQKFMSGIEFRAILEARKLTPDRSSQAYRQAVIRYTRQQLESMPYEIVRNDVKQAKTTLEFAREPLIIGRAGAMMDPVIEKTGALSSEFAFALPGARATLVEIVPVQAALVEAFAGYIAAHDQEKPDIWAARDVTLEPGKGFTPVIVAVWDSGVDTSLFRGQVVTDDGRPVVLAYDLQNRKTTGELRPISAEQARRMPEMESRMKGLLDLQANIDSAEASELKKVLAALNPGQVKPFIEELRLFLEYAHGTHVAGILMAGNPYARLVTSRTEFDHKLIPDPCDSRELREGMAAAIADNIAFFKLHGVRIVNMSWGESVEDTEKGLEMCGIGKDPQERKTIARELFDIGKNALERAMASAPDILFVAAAGNSDNDATFNEFIPSSIRLPNLLTAGAVDKAGDEAPFTSYGPTVLVHANGYEVESYVPGGDRLKLSGTSMAAPNVANLAAKMLAVNPKLKPPEVIEIIRKTAERSPDGRRFLIHPAHAIAAAKN